MPDGANPTPPAHAVVDRRRQGDLFGGGLFRGSFKMDEGGYPPESEPGYDPRVGGRWTFWRDER